MYPVPIPVTLGISIARNSRGGYALAESPSELEPTGSHKEKGPGAELCAELGSPTKEPTAQRYLSSLFQNVRLLRKTASEYTYIKSSGVRWGA